MKTSTIVIVGLVALLWFGSAPSGGPVRTGAIGSTPEPRPQPQVQSGGGDTLNQVLQLFTATARAVEAGLSTDRNAQG